MKVRTRKFLITGNALSLVWESLAWAFAFLLAVALRVEGNFSSISLASLAVVSMVLVLSHSALALVAWLRRGFHELGTFLDFRRLVVIAVSAWAPAVVVVLGFGAQIGLPRSTVLIALPVYFVLAMVTRLIARVTRESRNLSAAVGRPAIIYGAGELGEFLVDEMIAASDFPYRPVALLDDAQKKQNVEFRGVRVMGTWDMLGEVARQRPAEVVLVAIAGADSELLMRVFRDCQPLGIEVQVFPSVNEVLHRSGPYFETHSANVEDLIGRRAFQIDVPKVQDFLDGKTVLVTGAGGSIGSELVRQCAALGAQSIVLVDRDETLLSEVRLSLEEHQSSAPVVNELADIRDNDRVSEIFQQHKPQVVFHAAALKHLSFLEQAPAEAWKTNVLGTANVLHAARVAGVEMFVNISTDKAANPTSVLGISKKLGERMSAWLAKETDAKVVSVRFGNVLGSRGSVLPIFETRITMGLPLVVTHPDVSRYFMTSVEACQLVLQATVSGETGQVLVLDMGEPVKIMDIAERLQLFYRRSIEMTFGSLHEGEKIAEDLFDDSESPVRTSHPRVSAVDSKAIEPYELSFDKFTNSVEKLRDSRR